MEIFSNPAYLQTITPENMGFKVISIYHGDTLYAGQIIDNKVRPVLNNPIYWMTKITEVKDREYFNVVQQYGPFSFWHHQHHFEAIEVGVEKDRYHSLQKPFIDIGKAGQCFIRAKKKFLIIALKK